MGDHYRQYIPSQKAQPLSRSNEYDERVAALGVRAVHTDLRLIDWTPFHPVVVLSCLVLPATAAVRTHHNYPFIYHTPRLPTLQLEWANIVDIIATAAAPSANTSVCYQLIRYSRDQNLTAEYYHHRLSLIFSNWQGNKLRTPSGYIHQKWNHACANRERRKAWFRVKFCAWYHGRLPFQKKSLKGGELG